MQIYSNVQTFRSRNLKLWEGAQSMQGATRDAKLFYITLKK